MAGPSLCLVFLSFVAESTTKQLNTENLSINVTAGPLRDTEPQQSSSLQINSNISVGEEQSSVNDIPVELSAVTRFSCSALLLDSSNGSSEFDSGDSVSAVTRVMVSQNRSFSDSDEVVASQVFSEVIELEGKEVHQPDMCEVKISMSPEFQKSAQFTNIYPMGHSEIFRIPRENDVVVTDPPNFRREEEQSMSQTTSQYPHTERHTDTTQEEVAAPGELPETPSRMDPDSSSDVAYGEQYEDTEPGPAGQNEAGSSPKEEPSSYSAMCQWVEHARERSRRFCFESSPVFFSVMCVVVIGVVGSAFIVKVLDSIFPACEQKPAVASMPEEEKLNSSECAELEAPEEEKKP